MDMALCPLILYDKGRESFDFPDRSRVHGSGSRVFPATRISSVLRIDG